MDVIRARPRMRSAGRLRAGEAFAAAKLRLAVYTHIVLLGNSTDELIRRRDPRPEENRETTAGLHVLRQNQNLAGRTGVERAIRVRQAIQRKSSSDFADERPRSRQCERFRDESRHMFGSN